MIMVMHWAVKLNRLKTLKESEAISISVDDRKDYRLLRYRCSSTPKAQSPEAPSTLPAWSQVAPNVHEGLLGVFRLGQDVAENTLESHDEDKSKAMANSIEVMLRGRVKTQKGSWTRVPWTTYWGTSSTSRLTKALLLESAARFLLPLAGFRACLTLVLTRATR